MTGAGRQFGLAPGGVRPAALRRSLRVLKLIGFHIYSGTQIPDGAAFLASFERAFGLVAAAAESSWSQGARTLAAGGGFPMPVCSSRIDVRSE